MHYISCTNEKEGVEAMAQYIINALQDTEKVLWLVCGGSNIPYAVSAMQKIQAQAKETITNLTVALTDERFGEVGHTNSNWQQLKNAGFDFAGIQTIPILVGAPLEETVSTYAQNIEKAFSNAGVIIAQFGIGADGHIAGILPFSYATADETLVCGYEAGPFTRITLTPIALKCSTVAYAFVFGESKRAAVHTLQDPEEKRTIEEMPAQILKEITEAYLYSDQL